MIQKNILKSKMILQEKTQLEMAKVLGLSLVSVSKKINGVIKFNLEEVKKIKEYLNLTDEEINQIFLS
jgi:BetR domain.